MDDKTTITMDGWERVSKASRLDMSGNKIGNVDAKAIACAAGKGMFLKHLHSVIVIIIIIIIILQS